MNNNKITIVTSYTFPDDAATANRLSIFAEVLVKHGNYDLTVIGQGSKNRKFQVKNRPISVIQLKKRQFNKNKLFIRGFNEFIDSFRLLKLAKNTQADIYLISIPSITLLLSSILIKKHKVIYDVRDLVWEYLLKSSGIKKYAGFAIRKVSLCILSKSLFLTVTNDTELYYFKKRNIPAVFKISNGISQEKFNKLASLNSKNYDNSKDYLLVYVGNVGFGQNLKNIIDVIGNLRGFKLKVIGTGNDLQRLISHVKDNNFKNISFLGFKPWDEAMDHVKTADCLLGQINSQFKTAVPSKIYEYAVTGRPVIFGLPEGPAKKIAERLSNFYVYDPSNIGEFNNLLLQLKSKVIDEAEVSINRNFVKKNFIREVEAKKLNTLISEYRR